MRDVFLAYQVGKMTKRYGFQLAASISACLITLAASAKTPPPPEAKKTTEQNKPRAKPSSTSNTTTANDTRRASEQLSTIEVSAQSLSLGGGLMSVQTPPKGVS